jgi:hypothetical protein
LQPQNGNPAGLPLQKELTKTNNRQVLWQQKSDYSVMVVKATLIIPL